MDIQKKLLASKYSDCLQTQVDDNNNIWFNAKNIETILGVSNIRSILMNYDKTDKSTFTVGTSGGNQKMTYLSLRGLKRMLVNSRKGKAKDLAKTLGIDVNHIKYTCLEADVLGAIKLTFQGHSMIEQYAVGKYYVDLYLPEYKLAIECDEYRHKFAIEEDKQRELDITEFIEGIKFIRVRPDDDNFNIYSVLNEIHNHILAYNNNHVL